jgi:tRNA threonylcarbamoyladenosine biosynthesis protein TsaE
MSATLSLWLPDEAATDRVGAALGRALAPGDAVLLEGPLGAGKSALARAAIRARTGATEVPSPTYTLVQTYEGPDATLWHADLYRLSDPAEAVELGLDEAFARAIALIEWPDRLGPLRPARALTALLSFEPGREGRRLDLTGDGPGWDGVLAALEAAA